MDPSIVPQRRSRRPDLRRGSLRDRLLGLLLLNALPILALAVIAFRVHRGDARWAEIIPESLVQNGPYIAAGVIAFSTLAWVFLPLFGALHGRFRESLRASRARAGGGLGRRLIEALLFLPRLAIFCVLHVVLAVSWIATLAALVASLAFLARAIWPDAVDGWLPFDPPDPRALLGGEAPR